jgi:hypothetical protein
LAAKIGRPYGGNIAKTTRQEAAKHKGLKPMNYEQWESQYKPIKNTIAQDAPYGGAMFETSGLEAEAIKLQHALEPRKVWTVHHAESGNDAIIAPGLHLVNRLGYLITENLWDDENLEILDSEHGDRLVNENMNEEGDKSYSIYDHGDCCYRLVMRLETEGEEFTRDFVNDAKAEAAGELFLESEFLPDEDFEFEGEMD